MAERVFRMRCCLQPLQRRALRAPIKHPCRLQAAARRWRPGSRISGEAPKSSELLSELLLAVLADAHSTVPSLCDAGHVRRDDARPGGRGAGTAVAAAHGSSDKDSRYCCGVCFPCRLAATSHKACGWRFMKALRQVIQEVITMTADVDQIWRLAICRILSSR